MKNKDTQILNNLLENSRIEICRISNKEKIPVSTVFDRMQKLTTDGTIKKYCTIIDNKYLRHPIHSMILVKTNKDPPQDLKDYRINSIDALSTPDQYLISCYFKNLEDKEDFRKKLIHNKINILKEYILHEILKSDGFKLGSS